MGMHNQSPLKLKLKGREWNWIGHILEQSELGITIRVESSRIEEMETQDDLEAYGV